MKDLLDKFYDLFSSRLSKWFIFIGIMAYCLSVFINFLGGVISNSSETLYYIVVLAFKGLIAAGLLVGHYRNKEPLLLVSFIAFLAFLASNGVVGASFGISNLQYFGAPTILCWVFTLIFAIALGFFLVCVVLTYLFKVKGTKLLLKAGFFLSLVFGVLYWVFSLVSLADGANWTNAIVPLLEVASLLMIPGILEELLPGEIEEERKEENTASEE